MFITRKHLHRRTFLKAAGATVALPLLDAMVREVELFFKSVVDEDRDVLDLMTADYTYVNERLARHYGIPNVYGSRFRRVTIPDENR